MSIKVVLPFRGEFGLKCWWHVPAVHAIEGPKIVYGEVGEEALYPSAAVFRHVPRRADGQRRNSYEKDAAFVESIAATLDDSHELLKPTPRWARKRFVPVPYEVQMVGDVDIVVCPRRRDYGSEKNWPHWLGLTERLQSMGFDVFAGGAPDSSFPVPCAAAWDPPRWRYLDATIEAMHAARLVIATDAGLAHLAVLMGRPLLMITYHGLVAPGGVTDERGVMHEKAYWPVRMERYEEANHTGSCIELVDGWDDPYAVVAAVERRLEHTKEVR